MAMPTILGLDLGKYKSAGVLGWEAYPRRRPDDKRPVVHVA
jgi:hypothetical protein